MFCIHCGKENPDAAQFCNGCGKPPAVQPHARSGAAFDIGRFSSRLILLLLLVFLGWYILRLNLGSRPANQMLASVVRAPVTLTDEVQNLPAASWKSMGLNLPYAGTIDVDLKIVRGNPVDVFLTDADQMDTIKQANWSQVRTYSEFNALKTRIYHRAAQLRQGRYCLVIRDTSLGILSQSASDVAVKVVLNP